MNPLPPEGKSIRVLGGGVRGGGVNWIGLTGEKYAGHFGMEFCIKDSVR